MRALLVVITLMVWAVAVGFWSQLPERIPMHFGMNGVPDRFADKSVVSWFWMPTLGTVFAGLFGFVMPGWLRGMAHANSTMLNMPDQKRFRALSAEARVRVVDAMMVPLMWLGVVLQLLFGWIVWSSAEVALENWKTLPMAPTIAAIGLILVCSVALVFASNRAVADEVAREDSGG